MAFAIRRRPPLPLMAQISIHFYPTNFFCNWILHVWNVFSICPAPPRSRKTFSQTKTLLWIDVCVWVWCLIRSGTIDDDDDDDDDFIFWKRGRCLDIWVVTEAKSRTWGGKTNWKTTTMVADNSFHHHHPSFYKDAKKVLMIDDNDENLNRETPFWGGMSEKGAWTIWPRSHLLGNLTQKVGGKEIGIRWGLFTACTIYQQCASVFAN